MCYCGNMGRGTDTEIRVSTESYPGEENSPASLVQDSNPGAFDHESSALTTELSLLTSRTVLKCFKRYLCAMVCLQVQDFFFYSSSSVLIPNIDCVQIKFDTLSITVTVLYMCV